MPTREEILAEPAGEKLDAWVCEFVLGWKWSLGMYGNCRFLDDPEHPLIEPVTPAKGDEPECKRGKLHALPACSTTWEGAGLVMEKILSQREWSYLGKDFQACPSVKYDSRGFWCASINWTHTYALAAEGKSAPEAICKAALLAAVL